MVLAVVVLVVAPLAFACARPVADQLACRHRIELAPPREWTGLVRQSPRGSLVAAAAAVVVALRWGAEPLAALIALGALGVAGLAALVDRRCHRLPDVLVGPMALGLVVVATGWSVVTGNPGWLTSALAAGALSAVLLGVAWLVGMGLGDVKFGGALGLLVGWTVGDPLGSVSVALGLVGCAALGASLWWLVAGRRRQPPVRWFPFGPYLAGASLVFVLLLGPPGAPPGTTFGEAAGHREPPMGESPAQLVRPPPVAPR